MTLESKRCRPWSNTHVTGLWEEERAEAETPIVNVAVRERKSHKAGLRGKDAKSQIGPERDHGWKKPERGNDRRKPDTDVLGCGSSSKRIASSATFQGTCELTRWYVGKVFKRSQGLSVKTRLAKLGRIRCLYYFGTMPTRPRPNMSTCTHEQVAFTCCGLCCSKPASGGSRLT